MVEFQLKDFQEINDKLLHYILKNGNKGYVYVNGNTFPCKELNNVQIIIDEPYNLGLFFDEVRMMQSISEMFFTLSGRMDVEFVKIFSEKLKITDGDYGFFVNHVGKRMYELYGDQVFNAYNQLKKNKYSSQAILNMFMNHPTYLGQDCTLTIQFIISSNEELLCHLNYRSIDVIEYLKSDILIYSILLLSMKNWLDLRSSKLIITTPKMFILDSKKSYLSEEVLNRPKEFFADISEYKPNGYMNNRKMFSYCIDVFLESFRNKKFEIISTNATIPLFLRDTLLILLYYTKVDNNLSYQMLKNMINTNNPFWKNLECFKNEKFNECNM